MTKNTIAAFQKTIIIIVKFLGNLDFCDFPQKKSFIALSPGDIRFSLSLFTFSGRFGSLLLKLSKYHGLGLD